MKKTTAFTIIGIGTLWGLTETTIGPLIKTACSTGQSGSILTGVSFLFIAMAYALCPQAMSLLIILLVTALMKMASGLIFGIPLAGGGISHPIFAYVTEVGAFMLIATLMRRVMSGPVLGASMTGASSAALAAFSFPLVKFCTGIAGCVMAGTSIPTAYYYAYYAVGIATITAPMGQWMGVKISDRLVHTPLLCDRGREPTEGGWPRKYPKA